MKSHESHLWEVFPSSSHLSRSRRAAALLIATVILSASSSGAEKRPEIPVKAAFLVHFARYVDWPPGSFFSVGSAIVIGVLADPEFFALAEEIIEGKTVDNRPVEVRSFESPSDARGVHILFIGRSQKSNGAAIRRAFSQRPVFTIADFEGFAANGGVADFFTSDGKVRFAVNPEAATSVKLKISSKLLRVAKITE